MTPALAPAMDLALLMLITSKDDVNFVRYNH